MFGLHFVRNKPGINLIVLFAFTFLSGLTLAPLLVSVLSLKGGGAIVTNAFFFLFVALGGLSLFAMQTKRDFTSIGKILFIVLIVVVVGSLANMFLHSPILQLIIAMVSAVLFSVFILYDTQNIINGGYDSTVSAAVSLYLNFLNLFTSLLQIFGILGSSDD
jgi:modulator of FtsH protease